MDQVVDTNDEHPVCFGNILELYFIFASIAIQSTSDSTLAKIQFIPKYSTINYKHHLLNMEIENTSKHTQESIREEIERDRRQKEIANELSTNAR